MRVLLIYPPVTIWGKGKVGPHIPMGLVYIASYLEKSGHEVKILDTLAEGRDVIESRGESNRIGMRAVEIKKIIRKFKPELVGISVMFTAFKDDALDLAKLVKTVDKGIKVIVGGAHVSINPKSMVESEFIDFAVKGEGEEIMAEVVGAMGNKMELKDIGGLVYKERGKIFENKRMGMITNLDDLPFPALHLLNWKMYDDPNNVYQMRHPIGSMVTSRGCPNHCVYCSIHAVWEHSWRGRSPKNVVDEIEYLKKRFGIGEISFQDDSMSVDKIRMKEICEEIIRRKIDIKWTTPNGVAHWTLDKDMIRLMKKAGCYRITFGIESGNPEVRRWVGKPFSLAQAKELTKFANKMGMWTLATNIIGFPYETREEIEDTIKYAIESDVDMAFFFRLGPRPGTPVYEVFKKEGWLPKDERELYSEEVACETKHIKGKDLFVIQNMAYKRFLRKRLVSFLNPIRLLRKIRNVEDLRYVAKMGWAGLRMAKRLAWEKSGVTSKAFRV
jgi:magnesium-protoporphyrin IX monomethyl ester (oxidative) cyclase